MLTVVQAAYPLAPVSMDATGGAEQVMAMLDRALVTAGHHSIAVACEGSRVEGELLSFRLRASFDEEARQEAQRACLARIVEAIDRWDPDLVHMHGVDFYGYLPPEGVPVLATLHLPVSYYPRSVFEIRRAGTYLNCVSEAQRRTCPPCSNLLATIENGVLIRGGAGTDGCDTSRDYALALGRICPEKGFHLALEAASMAGVPLWIAGKVYPYADHQRYFEQEIVPRLRPPHRFLGPVGFARKSELLASARCLLAPSLAAETSSLVAMEAMSCGTPVIAFPSGALADMVEHERTGFLVTNVEEMAAAIARTGEIDPEECRHIADVRFSASGMARRYLELYGSLCRALQ